MIVEFMDNDNGYLVWLASHGDGFVLNCGRPPSPSYLVLHRATCGTISGTPSPGRRWTLSYQKVCADALAELGAWARQISEPSDCGICNPSKPRVDLPTVMDTAIVLARALSDRLHRIVPKGFHVWEADGLLRYSADSPVYGGGASGSYIAENLHNGDTMDERICWCAEYVLGEFQDFVAETTTEPWPGGRTMPSAHARVIGNKLHLWFGDADAPVLECEPIDLALLG
jgi:hypothetical protein